MHQFFETVAIALEAAGVVVLVLGFAVAIVLGIRAWVREGGHRAYLTLRDSIGLSILLGLEVLVAADLVRTVTSTPSLSNAAVLGIIVLIRTALSFSLQIEIEGVVPWKRAFLPAGAQIVDRARRRTGAAEPRKADDSSAQQGE